MPRDSAKKSSTPARERRGQARPHDGDVVRCPKCHKDTFEFNARWRIPGPKATHVTVPAWMCDDSQCRFFRFARRSGDDRPLTAAMRKASQELRTQARRELMKARFIRQRAGRVLDRSLPRKKGE